MAASCFLIQRAPFNLSHFAPSLVRIHDFNSLFEFVLHPKSKSKILHVEKFFVCHHWNFKTGCILFFSHCSPCLCIVLHNLFEFTDNLISCLLATLCMITFAVLPQNMTNEYTKTSPPGECVTDVARTFRLPSFRNLPDFRQPGSKVEMLFNQFPDICNRSIHFFIFTGITATGRCTEYRAVCIRHSTVVSATCHLGDH